MAHSSPGPEQRRHARLDLSLLVQFRSDTFEQFLSEYATNLSAGGIFIRTDLLRAVGDLLYFQFFLKDGSRLIEGLGRVVRVNPPETHGTDAGMGLEFVDLDEPSIALINQIISARQKKA